MMYKNKPFILNLLSIACAILFLGACQQEEKKQAEEQETGPGYFSIKEFAADQFGTFWGQPFTLQKIIHLNGKTDTLYKDAYNMEWGEILKLFFETDISAPEFLGKYQFSDFEDNITQTRNFYYEAIDPKLFTQKLQIMVDPFSLKIKSIYIETSSEQKQGKLLYIPLKTIQIQEYSNSFTAGEKTLQIEYRFL